MFRQTTSCLEGARGTPECRFMVKLFLVFFALIVPCLGETMTVGQVLTSRPVETLLLVCGGVFLVLSIVTMGTGVAEFLCFSSFTLLFAGRYLQGEDPWVPLALLLAGVLCLLAEVFVLPGFGICGILGLLSIGTMTVLVAGNTTLGFGIFLLTTMLSVVAGFLAVRLLPNSHLTRRLFILQPPEAVAAPAPAPLFLPEVGEQGEAATSLRPGGYAMFGTERVDVTSDNEFVAKGQAIEVVRVDGDKVVVRSVRTPSQP